MNNIFRRLLISSIFGAVLIAALGGVMSAQDDAVKKMRVKAVTIKKSGADKNGVITTTLETAQINQEDAQFNADTIVIKSKGNVHDFTCTGNPIFTDPENRITGDKVIGHSTPRQAEFIGNVKMVSTPKPKAQPVGDDIKSKINSEPSTTTCDHLLYDYSAKRGLAKGNVIIKQTARTVWANEAVYDQNLELVTLKGNVRMKNTGEEEVKEIKDAETVTVSLVDDWVDMVAKKGGLIELDIEYKDSEAGNGKK